MRQLPPSETVGFACSATGGARFVRSRTFLRPPPSKSRGSGRAGGKRMTSFFAGNRVGAFVLAVCVVLGVGGAAFSLGVFANRLEGRTGPLTASPRVRE